MFRHHSLIFLCILMGVLWCSSYLDAGILIPTQTQYYASITEKDHFVTVVINNQLAVTRVTQTFVNRSNVDLEAIYQFTLPSGAKIHSFAMWIKERKMYGAIVEKERGREIYEKIKRDKIDPALLEHVSGNTYKIRVFPVQAGKEQRIELAYWQVLSYDSGTVSYLYPLKEEKTNHEPVNFAFGVKVISAIPISTITSETHKISKTQQDPYNVTAGFEDPKSRFDKDLRLVYVLEKKKFGVDLICYRPEPGKDGYFMALLTPPEENEKAVAKAITFVFDISGSMSGEKIEQTKSALLQCVNSLRACDLFNLILFETSVRTFAKELLPASIENKKNAIQFISGLTANGATNLYEAIQLALASRPQNMPHVVALLTDGRPNIGEANPCLILEQAKKLCTEGTRIFTFGVGTDVNHNLLESLARENKGTSLFIRSDENLEMPVSLFFKKIANPVLTQINLDFQEACVSQIFPKHITELFQGTQMVITGRYKNPGVFPVKMEGFKEQEKLAIIERSAFLEDEKENEIIARLWASETIDYLLYQVRQGKEDKEVKDEIIRLSKTWGIITPYTSYLVLESDQDYNQWNLKPNIGKDDIYINNGLMRTRTGTGSIDQKKKTWEEGLPPADKPSSPSSNARPISFKMEDPICMELVRPHQVLVNGRVVTDADTFEPGQEVEIVAKFLKYKTVKTRVKIEPGQGPMIPSFNLEKLKCYDVRIVMNAWEEIYGIRHPMIDGIRYSIKIFADGNEVEDHHIWIDAAPKTAYLTIWALSDIKSIDVELGFYRARSEINPSPLGGYFKIMRLDQINPSRLIEHLKSLHPHVALNRIDKIVREERIKLKNMTQAEKDQLIQYIKNELKDVPDYKHREMVELLENIK